MGKRLVCHECKLVSEKQIELSINLCFENTVISGSNNKYIITSVCDVEEFDSALEIGRYCRAELLIILNLISYFSGVPFNVYQVVAGRTIECADKAYLAEEILLIVNDIDYTDDVKKVLRCLAVERDLIISLLDRWRKATYLMEESYDANLYHDEAILNFFHILELFAETQNEKINHNLKQHITVFLNSYFQSNFFLSEGQVKGKVQSKLSILKEVLIKEESPIVHKIKFFLKEYDLLDRNVSYLIDRTIKVRNAIAHGRLIYKEKMLWPLPPFFYLTEDSYDLLYELQILSAKMIAAYLKISCWDFEWNSLKQQLLPPDKILEKFLDNPNSFPEVNNESLCIGNIYNITWNTIFQHYINNRKRFSINKLVLALKRYLISTEVNEQNGSSLFNISIVLCDCEDTMVANKSKSNVIMIKENSWYDWSNYKDAFRFLEYNNIPAKWYREYLENKIADFSI